MQEETTDLIKTTKFKSQKSNELAKQREELEKKVAEADILNDDFGQCQMVMSRTLAEQWEQQDEMRALIAQIKR